MMKTRTHPKTSFYCDRLQRPWICVVGKKGSRRASARLRAFFTSSLDHDLFARSRYKTGLGMGSNAWWLRGALIVLGLMVYQLSAAPSRRPNIVLIMADDLGYECLRVNGGRSYHTPRLDALAAQGLRFTHCHAQPVCTPSRVKIMTGRYNFRNYVSFETLSPQETTFGHLLQAAGYQTCIAGKWQLSGRGQAYVGTSPVAAGFDTYCLWQMDRDSKGSRYWNPKIEQDGHELSGLEQAYGPDVFTQYICDFMAEHKDWPFFVYYPMALTHGPHVPTPDSGMQINKKVKRDTRYFADMVTYTDKLVGQILGKIEGLGLSDNTLVLFTGDNGTDKKVTSVLGERQIKGGKGSSKDAGTHVPLLAFWQGVTPNGRVCDDLIDFSDFVPTLVELSGASAPSGSSWDGISFLPQLRGQPGHPKEYIFCHYDKGKHPIAGQAPKKAGKREAKTGVSNKASYTRWVRDKRWKLYDNGKLFDVIADPDEQQPIQAGIDPAGDRVRKRFHTVLDNMNYASEGL